MHRYPSPDRSGRELPRRGQPATAHTRPNRIGCHHAPRSRCAVRGRPGRCGAAPAPDRHASPSTPATKRRTGRAAGAARRRSPRPARASASPATTAARASARPARAARPWRSPPRTACSCRGPNARRAVERWTAHLAPGRLHKLEVLASLAGAAGRARGLPTRAHRRSRPAPARARGGGATPPRRSGWRSRSGRRSALASFTARVCAAADRSGGESRRQAVLPVS